jgi:DNA-binding MarR family transcriptional regulator
LNEHEQRTWRAYLEASQLVASRLDRELQQDAGLPHGYYELLVRLSEAPERRLRMSTLATTSWSSRSRLSHAVGKLEALGWVRRESCPSDGRGSFAVLTDEGMAVLEAAAPGHVEAVRRHLFDPLSAAQVDQLREICEALLASLTEADDDPLPVAPE